MSDDKSKKPKIDLKARLGKTSAGTASLVPGPPSLPGAAPSLPGAPPSFDGPGEGRVSLPAPPSSLSIAPPLGIAPPPGIAPPTAVAGSLAPNPFAPKPAPAPAPAPKPAPVSAESQTIKVELGEEIHEERKKATKKSIIFATIAMVAGVGLGWVAGGNKVKSERADVAVQGAKKLEVEVNEATKKIEDLLPILKEAEDGLKAKKYPTAVVGKLAGFAVPFKAENLDGKGAGNMPAGLQRQMFTFLKKCEDLEDKKNALKNILGGLQKNLETAWAEEQKPMMKLAVSFSTSGGNTLAQMVRIKEPWEAGASSWPKEPKVLVPTVRDGRKTEEEKGATRWEKGDLTGSNPIVIPVDPSTVAQFTDEKVVFQLFKAIADIKLLLNGDSTPGNETNGLLKDGEVLSNDLGKLGMRR